MKKFTRRNFIAGGVIGALAVAPFILRGLRKTTQLPQTPVVTFEAMRDPSVVPSGKINVVNDFITFEPLALPKEGIQSWTLNAVLSNDNKWLIVSYCFGKDSQSQICYAPIGEAGLPGIFAELENFGQKSVVTALGCSSINRGSGSVSYCVNKTAPDSDTCSSSLHYVPFQRSEKKLAYSSDPFTLTKREYPIKDWNISGVGRRNHVWFDDQNAFISEMKACLYKTDCGNVEGDRFRILHKLQNGKTNSITSNLFFDGTTISFLETPVRTWGIGGKLDPTVDPYRTDAEGLLVSLNSEGSLKSKTQFPVPSHSRKTLITKTHCLFPSTGGGQFFTTAELVSPQDYYDLRFSHDEIELPGSGINYVYNPLVILPSGRHLLCSRDVGISFIKKAQQLRLPLSTLGIIELPFKIG